MWMAMARLRAAWVHAPGGMFDEEQDVELAETDGVNDEGVARDDPSGLCSEELGPGRSGASRGGIDERDEQPVDESAETGTD